MIVKAVEMKEVAEKALEGFMTGGKLFTPSYRTGLQFFAGEGEGAGEGSGEGEGGSGEGAGEGEGNNEGGEGEGAGEGSGGSGKGSKDKSFTQDDVNAIAAKEAKKAQEKLLKQLGVKDFKSAKEGLTKLQEIQDSQKTDSEKAVERAKLLEEEKATLEQTTSKLNAQVAAMKLGVSPESLDDAIILANNLVNEDTTIDDAIKEVLKKYPNFKTAGGTENTGKGTKKPKFSDGEHNNGDKPTDQDKWLAAFNFGGANK